MKIYIAYLLYDIYYNKFVERLFQMNIMNYIKKRIKQKYLDFNFLLAL